MQDFTWNQLNVEKHKITLTDKYFVKSTCYDLFAEQLKLENSAIFSFANIQYQSSFIKLISRKIRLGIKILQHLSPFFCEIIFSERNCFHVKSTSGKLFNFQTVQITGIYTQCGKTRNSLPCKFFLSIKFVVKFYSKTLIWRNFCEKPWQ